MEKIQDFIDKKEKLANLIESYIENQNQANELLSYINELSNDREFKDRELFRNIFTEFIRYLPELSRKELKQRVLMIRGFLE